MRAQRHFLAAIIALMLCVSGCTSPATQQEETNKQLFQRGVEAINSRNWDTLDELVAPNYVRHCQATPDVKVSSLEDFKQYLEQDVGTFPDSRMTIQRVAAEGNLLAFFGTYVGTQQGQMGPFPASNKQMSLEFAGIHRIENGKLVETWLTWDNLSALSQLGHFPQQPQATQL